MPSDLGYAGIVLLNATTSAKRMANLMRVWAEVHDGQCPYGLFVCLPGFARYFKPLEILGHLFAGSCERIGLEPFRLSGE